MVKLVGVETGEQREDVIFFFPGDVPAGCLSQSQSERCSTISSR